MNYRVAPEFDGPPKQALLSSLAVFLAVKFTIRLPSPFFATSFATLPSCFYDVLAANEKLFRARTLLERYLACEAVLKWLSLEPTFPTLQELARRAAGCETTSSKPRDFLFEGVGVLDGGEVVSFDHCKTTLGQRRWWKGLHQKDGLGPFWMLLRQIAEPDQELSVDWLEMAFNFADHWWVSKFLNSGQFPIYDGMLRKLAIRVLSFPPACTKIEECDIFALPSWNECSWSDGHVLKDFLDRISEAQCHRMAPLLLRESSGFGFGSPEIFSLLLSKVNAEWLQAYAEDLLVRLIRDSFHESFVQQFLVADVPSRCPVVVTCFDPLFVDAQRRKLAYFVAVAIKLGLRVDWDACLVFCCKFGDAPRAQIIFMCALGDVSQLDTPRFVAASLQQWNEGRKASLLKFFGRDPPKNWFFRELFHVLSSVSVFLHLYMLLRIEVSLSLHILTVGLLSLSFYVGTLSVTMRMLQLFGRWPSLLAFFSCFVPFALNAHALLNFKRPFYWSSWALCCGYALLLWWQSRMPVSSRSGQYWQKRGTMIFSTYNFLPIQMVSTNQRVAVATLLVFLCVQVWYRSGLYAAAILLLASLVSVMNCARAFVNYYKLTGTKRWNIYLAGFCLLFCQAPLSFL